MVINDGIYISNNISGVQYLWKWNASSNTYPWLKSHHTIPIFNFVPLSINTVLAAFRIDTSGDYYLFKINYSSSSTKPWGKISCPTSGWTEEYAGSILSSDKTKIYTAFTYDSKYIFYSLNSTSGALTSPGIMRTSNDDNVQAIVEANGLVILLLYGVDNYVVVINPLNSEVFIPHLLFIKKILSFYSILNLLWITLLKVLKEFRQSNVQIQSIAVLASSEYDYLYMAGADDTNTAFYMTKVYPQNIH